jgi:hypothetical protein
VTADDFRKLALGLPEAVEAAHMGHPDFRAGGKIFATLGWPDEAWAMVRVPVEVQEMLSAAEPTVFSPVPGVWGRKGATRVHLVVADASTVRGVLATAWRTVAPKRLVRQAEGAQGL